MQDQQAEMAKNNPLSMLQSNDVSGSIADYFSGGKSADASPKKKKSG